MNLKVSKEEYFVVDYQDFDEYVTEVYGLNKRFDCVCVGQLRNDSCYQFQAENICLEGELDLPNNDGNEGWLSDIFTDLCYNGLIKEGNYLLTVCW